MRTGSERISVDEVGIDPLCRSHDLDNRVTLHDLFPKDPELQFDPMLAPAVLDKVIFGISAATGWLLFQRG
jgi:hypothetical protein